MMFELYLYQSKHVIDIGIFYVKNKVLVWTFEWDQYSESSDHK